MDNTKETYTDVLIVGAGPAGMMMAAWMAKCGINYRIVDKRGTKIFNRQADGLQVRTLEILESMGVCHRVRQEGRIMTEMCFWNPDEKGIIRRSDRKADTMPGNGRYLECTLNQGRIERFFLDEIKACGGNTVERGVMPSKLVIEKEKVDDPNAYPVTVTLRHLTEEEATPKQSATASNGAVIQDGLFRSNLADDDTEEMLKASKLNMKAGKEEVVKAKYVLGSDGAHSWVRKELGFQLEGDSTDYIWGVVDIVPITDFPDIRNRCAIHSAESGSVMVIPREGRLVRLYIQLTTTSKTSDRAGEKADRSGITPDTIMASARRIFAPYNISYRRLDWWTAYQIGQRVGKNFSAYERVFLSGDAVYTHSPKAGQGMNVSMQDSFNLGWKVAGAVKGLYDRQVLKTYQSERRRIAQDLIRIDHKLSRLFSGRPAKDVMDEEGISTADFKKTFEEAHLFLTGTAVNYGPSIIVAKTGDSTSAGDGTDVAIPEKYRVQSKPSLAPTLPIGQRIKSTRIVNQADAQSIQLHDILPSNGTWRIIAFAGDVHLPSQLNKIQTLAKSIENKTSFFNRFTPPNTKADNTFEFILIHSAPREEYDIFSFPQVFRPFDEVNGWDYNKLFVDGPSYDHPSGKIHEMFGIKEDRGCVVVLRPDQHVAFVGELEDVEPLDTFFEGFMIERKGGENGIADSVEVTKGKEFVKA
ncbi:hypothetical protein K470DRAFT_250053 [Piedraia hortae CBS 480.64]|uniref:Phenol 2-monooxygenase n=1 Tax=Piedraia hortae CBS 480.64 TaxID=1314780 RepID=A0A6A7BVE4_9PEZI|nr:hypothetical protein K470DRAFT_250053 [Piedraia hortae CBS 480.64]